MKFKCNTVFETHALAARLAEKLRGGEIILLGGDLGAGKTTFTKGLAKALGIQEVVTSPTFTFMKSYAGRLTLYHYDMYRVTDASELYELGLEEYLGAEGGVCVIEWNKFENLGKTITVNICGSGDDPRLIEVEGIEL